MDVGTGLEVGQLSVKTANGDAQVNDLGCQELLFHSASGTSTPLRDWEGKAVPSTRRTRLFSQKKPPRSLL